MFIIPTFLKGMVMCTTCGCSKKKAVKKTAKKAAKKTAKKKAKR